MGAAGPAPVEIVYRVDAGGVIRDVGGPWDEWLQANDPAHIERSSMQSVIGKSVFSFIEGEAVRHIYAILHERVLKTGRPIEFAYRCDGPRVRREMRMRLAAESSAILYVSSIEKETVRQRALPEPTPGAPTMIAVCSFCKNYRFPVASRAWKDIDALFLEPELPAGFAITHGLCESCAETVLKLATS